MGPVQRLALITSGTIGLLLLAGCASSSTRRSAGCPERDRRESDLRGQRGHGVPGAGGHKPHYRQPHQSRVAAHPDDGHVPSAAGAGRPERYRHLRAGTDDASPDGERLSRHGGAGDDPAVRHAEPDDTAAAELPAVHRQQLPAVLVVYRRIGTARRRAPVAALSGMPGAGLQRSAGRQRSAAKHGDRSECPGVLRVLGPLGDDQRNPCEHQSSQGLQPEDTGSLRRTGLCLRARHRPVGNACA